MSACNSPGPGLGSVLDEINGTLEWRQNSIACGDVLAVRFAENSSWDHSVTVRPDGSATFLGLTARSVAGLTEQELEAQLVESYAPMFSDRPRVSIQATPRAPLHVLVMGEVHEPGEVPFDGQVNFHEALALAGGPLKETAYLGNTILIRWITSEARQRVWKFDARTPEWTDGRTLHLQPDDVIFVPNTTIDEVDIWVDQYIRRMLPFPYIVPPIQ